MTKAWRLGAARPCDSPAKMANALVDSAQNYVGLGDIEQAKSAWREARRLAPRYVDARTDGVSVFRRAEDRKRSVTFLRIAAGLELPEAAQALR